MFDLNWQVIGEVCIRTLVIYAALLVGIRLSGKREIGQMTPFDLVVLLLISNAVQNAMTGPDTSLAGGIVAALTLLVANAVVSLVRMRSPAFQRFVEGVPIPLVAHGKVQYQSLRRERMTMADLEEALREHEVHDVSEVELAMLEVDGTISVIRQSAHGLVRSRKKLIHHHKRG
jgi:uncharacterized membrane protein YcaP (DUF421 family)